MEAVLSDLYVWLCWHVRWTIVMVVLAYLCVSDASSTGDLVEKAVVIVASAEDR